MKYGCLTYWLYQQAWVSEHIQSYLFLLTTGLFLTCFRYLSCDKLKLFGYLNSCGRSWLSHWNCVTLCDKPSILFTTLELLWSTLKCHSPRCLFTTYWSDLTGTSPTPGYAAFWQYAALNKSRESLSVLELFLKSVRSDCTCTANSSSVSPSDPSY